MGLIEVLPPLLVMAFFVALMLALIYATVVSLLGTGQAPPHRGADSGPDGGGDGGPSGGPQPGPPSGGIPLPDARPTRFRFRGHGRLADLVPARPRRDAREPDRQPSRLG